MKATSPAPMPRPRWPVLGVALLLLVVAAIGLRWWSISPTPPQPASAPPLPTPTSRPTSGAEFPFLKIEQSRLAGSDRTGRKQWELQAKTLQVDKEKNTVTLTEIKGQLYQAGAPRFAFTAPRGVLFIGTRDVELSGGISGQTTEGWTLQASQFRWDAAHQQFIASGGVTLTQPGMTIHAEKVVSDAMLHQTTFTGKIKVTVTR